MKVHEILQDIYLCSAVKQNFQTDGKDTVTYYCIVKKKKAKKAEHYFQCEHVDHRYHKRPDDSFIACPALNTSV